MRDLWATNYKNSYKYHKLLMLVLSFTAMLSSSWASERNEIDWTEEIMNTIIAGSQDSQIAMAVGTGKWVNDLGQFDFWNENPGIFI